MKTMTPRTLSRAHAQRGFTMVELVITVIIIAILVGIAVPVMQERARAAKLASARTDMEHIANAEERLTIDTGYMYRLFMLDDIRGAGDGNNTNPAQGIDAFVDEMNGNGIQTVTASNFFIDPRTGQFIDAAAATAVFNRLSSSETSFTGGDILNTEGGVWNGPYMNWTRDNNVVQPDGTRLGNDIPDDPWGNDYILFTQAGIINETDGNPSNANMKNAPTINGIASALPDGIDRPAVLSLGPDGVPGAGGAGSSQLGTNDDLVRKF